MEETNLAEIFVTYQGIFLSELFKNILSLLL